MRPTILTFFASCAAVTAIGWFALSHQRETMAELRLKTAQRRARMVEAAQAVTMIHDREKEVIAVVPGNPPDDDQAALARLREEFKAIVAATEARVNDGQGLPPAMALPSQLWRDAGTVLPSAALETALWAAARGKVDRLAEVLIFAPDVQTKADALYADLPPAVQAQYPSPLHLVAHFTARDIPITAVVWNGWNGGADKMKLSFRFPFENGTLSRREIELETIRTPAGWRLSIPLEVVEKYMATLKAGTVSTNDGK